MNVISPPGTMLQVFEGLPEGTLCQLINNQLVMSPAPSDPHQSVLLDISTDLNIFVKKNNLGALRIAPYDVYFNKENVFQPDIVFVAKENTHKIKKNGLHGAPDLVIEILSPATEKYDRGNKKEIYEKYGVKEYWLVEPESKQVTFYSLINDEYVEVEVKKAMINSKLLGVSINFN